MVSPITPTTPPPDASSLASGDYTSTNILNNIFSKLLSMVSTLQNVAASQANRLTFMAQWQQEYTDAMAQMHTFTEGDGSFLSGNSDGRTSMNNFNSTELQAMGNRQSVVSNNAKALQSNVNQSNDAVNSQSSLGTSILQELSTLLGNIFK